MMMMMTMFYLLYIFYWFKYFRKIIIEKVQMNMIADLIQILFIFMSSRLLTSWQQRHYVISRLSKE